MSRDGASVPRLLAHRALKKEEQGGQGGPLLAEPAHKERECVAGVPPVLAEPAHKIYCFGQ